jgi:hypothetical protein
MLLLLCACALTTPGSSPSPTELSPTPEPTIPAAATAAPASGENWAILAPEDVPQYWQRIHGQVDGLWIPSETDIQALESALPTYLQENADLFYRDPPVWERLDEYKRQYFGYNRDGKRFIYGNFFCHDMGIDYKTILVEVEDGGECYFQFKYDADSGEFFDLMVNGEA